MHYVSTRGYGPVTFSTAMVEGMAPDGGLYVPTHYPHFSKEEIENFTYQSYEEIAFRVMYPFVEGEIPEDTFKGMIDRAYRSFKDIDITPVVQFDENMWLMELFHGPTYAFKDVAMQMLGQMIDYICEKEETHVTVVGSTSGDTGPAAIAGFEGKEHAKVFMLFPHNRVSIVQRLQMTTSKHDNIYPIAIEGTFDDCQKIVKSILKDAAFKEHLHTTSVNSISWARLMPQIVYYFFAWSRLREIVGSKPLTFSVPTGNFGDVFAGYAAMQCGLPINKLLIANNENDILTRFIHSGDFSAGHVVATRSPSMDIQLPSNFERLLFDVYGRSAKDTTFAMTYFADHGKLPPLSATQMDEVRSIFAAEKIGDIDMLKTISEIDATKYMVLDPHSATAVAAAKKRSDLRPMVALATAHPIKFQKTVSEATGKIPELNEEMEELMKTDEKFDVLPNDELAVREFIIEYAS